MNNKTSTQNVSERQILDLPLFAIAILRNHLDQAQKEITDLLSKEDSLRLKVHAEVTPVQVPKTEAETPKPVDPAIPDFDPQDLIMHAWKGRKLGEGRYAEGSVKWGWDFRENFKPETIKVLEQDAILAIGEYEFALTEKIVQARKAR